MAMRWPISFAGSRLPCRWRLISFAVRSTPTCTQSSCAWPGRVPGVAVLAELVRITDVTATGSGLTECVLVLRVKIT